MTKYLTRFSIIGVVAVATLGLSKTRKSELVVHEWGTFTTVAAQQGGVVQWLPLGGPADLPCFVNVVGGGVPGLFKVAFAVIPNGNTQTATAPPKLLNDEQARVALRGSVRMETPVLYFYSPNEEVVDVKVNFPKGLITEWYPPAAVAQPPVTENVLAAQFTSSVLWKSVSVRPGSNPTLPVGIEGPSHYYAARAVDAATVSAAGYPEKFLFYRGVGDFPVPIDVTVEKNGSVLVKNLGTSPVPSVVLFENRGGKVGYRVASSISSNTVLERPELNSSVAELGKDLEKMLVSSGLFAREAKAMVDTWRDSWFEDGLRVFYILPQSDVDAILPLSVAPAPKKVVRSFVGRMEVIDDVTMKAVAGALSSEDDAAIQAYGRFLAPIVERMLEKGMFTDRAKAFASIESSYKAYVERLSLRCK